MRRLLLRVLVPVEVGVVAVDLVDDGRPVLVVRAGVALEDRAVLVEHRQHDVAPAGELRHHERVDADLAPVLLLVGVLARVPEGSTGYMSAKMRSKSATPPPP